MRLQVETMELQRAANDIEELLSDYIHQYRNLYTIATNIQEVWQGKDQEAFLTKLNEFESEFMKLTTKMDEYIAFLRTSSKAYQNTQNAVFEQAGRLVRR